MKLLDTMVIKLQNKVHFFLEDLKESERGDTNFVSMLLIIGIVVVLAGAFLTIAKTNILTPIKLKITNFINSLG